MNEYIVVCIVLVIVLMLIINHILFIPICELFGGPPLGIGWAPGGYPLGEYDPNMYPSEIVRSP